MSKFSVVCLLFSVGFLGLISRQVDACSCQPAHPQEHYCRSDFVIKALVGKARLVELGPNGEFKRIHKNRKRFGGKTESSGFPENVEPAKTEKTDDTPKDEKTLNPAPIVIAEEPAAPRYIAPLGPDTRMPGYRPQGPRHIAAIEDAHPPGHNSHASINRQKRNVLRPQTYEDKPIYNGPVGQAPGASAGQPKPRTVVMMQYRINIIQTFKGLENITKLQRMFMYTPPAPLCDMKLTTNRSPYILMGNVQDGALLIKVCDHKVDLSKLSPKEAKNLKKNMEKRYPAGCEQCYVKVCNMGDCDRSTYDQPFQCVWKDWRTTPDPLASQFACLETKGGRCKWYNGQDRTMKPEDILVR